MAGASIVVFSDFTCPFSYVTEAALRPLAAAVGVEVEYRAFELYPTPAPLPPPPAGEGEGAAALHVLAGAAGVELGVPALMPRTRKAHETARFARTRGHEGAVRDAIFRAYWREGKDIGRIDVLTVVAAEAGLAPDDVKIALDIDAHADEVVRERFAAERLGIRHTPTLIIGAGAAPQLVVGAQSADELRSLLHELAASGDERTGRTALDEK